MGLTASSLERPAALQRIAESEALESGMQEKNKEFVESGAEIYAKT